MTNLNTTTTTTTFESNINAMIRLLGLGLSRDAIIGRFQRRYAAATGCKQTRVWVAGRVDIYARIAYKVAGVHETRQNAIGAA